MKIRTSEPTTIATGIGGPDQFTRAEADRSSCVPGSRFDVRGLIQNRSRSFKEVTTRKLFSSQPILPVVRRVGVVHCLAIVLLVFGFASPLSGQTPAIATVDLTAGWATFGEAVPQGAATTGLQIGNLPTQTDIKNRWPDGSIRFAIVTAHVPGAGRYPVTAAAPAAGDFLPTLPSASATLVLGGITYTATLPSVAGPDPWLSGPLVAEGRSVVTPVTAGGTPHDFLRVNFDTRVYSDGKARVDVSVENLLDKVGATTVTYDARIVVNHRVRFAKDAVRHVYLTRWRQVFEIGSTPLAAVTPDLSPFTAAGALPAYLSLVTDVVSTPAGAAYDILREGALTANMPDARSRPELAPLPDWTARYLVHRHATQRAFVLANGDLSGSWPVHVREADASATGGVGAERFVSLDQRPTLWYDARAAAGGLDHLKGTPLPLVDHGTTVPGAGQTALIPDNAHQPSIAFVPYLLTGDRYYAEEMAFWATYGLLRTDNQDGIRGAEGILAANGAAGYAWALRNLADAAAYYPDASPVRAYLTGKVTANLAWLDAYATAVRATANGPVLWPVQQPDGTLSTNPTDQATLAYAIDRASQHGFAGGLTHRDAIAKAQVQVSTPVSSSLETRLVLLIGIENAWSGAQAAYDAVWPSVGALSSSGQLADLAQRAGWAVDFFTAPRGAVSDAGITPPTVTTSAPATGARTTAAAMAVTISAAGAPVSVVFHASTDHATVVSYLLEVFDNGSDPDTATPLASSDLGKPVVDASGDITVDRSTFFNALAPGTYLVTVSAIGPGGLGRSNAVTFTASVVPTATFSVSPTSISSGQSATLSWSTTDATTVTIDQGVGTVSASGTRSVSPTATTIYTLTATSAAGSVTATASVTVTAAADTSAPELSGVASSGLTTTSATITFMTNELSYHQVEYGPTATYGTMTALDTTLRTSHSHVLTGLTPGTVYHYRGRATDASGNEGMSGDFTFTTSSVPLPTATLTASPTAIVSGAASTLTWSTTGATTVSIDQSIGNVAASGTSSVSPSATTTYTLTATNAAGSVTATAAVTVNASGAGGAISVDFVGRGVAMGATESAGLVAKANWNSASGATSSTPLPLKDDTGAATGATVTWRADSVWSSPVIDQAGDYRMMKGYLSTGAGGATTVTVAGLAAGAYDVYLYVDGDNGTNTRSGAYQISGAGITTTTVTLTDAAGTNFTATFTPGNNSPGNVVTFSGLSIAASGFTVTATPGIASDGVARAPINGIQIVSTGKTTPTISWATPASISSGTPLSAAQLNATTTVAGTFVYTPPSGTVLGVGAGQTLSVTFTPTDTGRYNETTATVLITVLPVTKPVPNVVGQTQAAATTAITGAGLVVGTVTTASSATVPSGSVISSSPVAGTQVAAGSAVNLVVSTGPAPVAVPNVVGQTQAVATTAITGAGLVVGTVTMASSATVASGSVISSSPVAGTQVAAGSAVNLVVSTGPAPVAVPNVVGQTQAAATTAITGAGLVVGTVTTASSATVPSGSVISSSPVAGTQVAAGSAVNLVVSTGPAPVAVPNVVGQTQAAATTAITGAGLVVGTVTTASSATVPSGSVISSSPVAGTQVAAGSAVNLVVSTGPAPVAVPNVVGQTQAAATTAITGAGLVVGTVTTASSATVPSGSVISSSPVAGTQVAAGSAVNLVVSTGPAPVAVPNVVGQTQAAATTAITGAGLVVGTVTTASSATVPSGSVISSSPVAGTQVAAGSAVNLVVSTGPAPVAVPNVVGQTQAAATTAITGAGLVVGTVTTASSATVPSGSVISSSPVAGTQVAAGSAVNLVVSTGPAPVAVPNVVGQTQAAATTAITGAGLVVGTVTTASSATVASGSVISSSPVAGTQVAAGSAVNLVVSTGPAPVAVPNVVGQTQAAATTAITGAGLVVGTVTTASSATVPSGSVISSSPVAGTQVAAGSAVNLVVSTGPAPVAVPNVVGQTQAAATTAITGAGLVVGTVTTASSATVASGSVISSSPVAGTQVAAGSAVNLVVSTGPAPVAVPNVVGQTQAAATTAITGAGLVVGTVTTALSATVPSGSVISSSPVAGTFVAAGSAVNLVVSTSPAPVAVPNVVGQTQAAATTAITGAGLVVGTVTNASSLTVPSGSVISSSPVAGTFVAAGSAVNLVVSIGALQAPPPATALSIWSASAAPPTFATSDRFAAELGLRFRADVAGMGSQGQ